MASATFLPSKYQQAILDFVRSRTDSAIVVARAGSGKTSTLMMLDKLIRELAMSAVFLAFNKSIAVELQKRGANASTFHSIAFRALGRAMYARNKGRRMNVDGHKVSNIIERLYGRRFECGPALERLVSLVKNHGYNPTDLTLNDVISLIDHFVIEWEDDRVSDSDMYEMVRRVLTENNRDTVTIDFDDQLYFVHLFNVKMDTYDFVLVDESQDTNPLRRMLVRRMMHSRSRVIAVGDDRQAIYGFTGASHDALDLIASEFDATRLPLSISYRCPRLIIELARTIVPDIEARDNAPDGTILRPSSFKRSEFLPTDLIICRNTAPLVQTAYKLIAARIPCKIMGRDIGRGLVTLIKKLAGAKNDLEILADRITAYQTSETAKALAAKKETKAQSIEDKCQSILAIIDSMSPEDAARGVMGLCDIITGMFDDRQQYGMTTLATVHKAKGMEAPRVFIVDANLMPSKYARLPWQRLQEENLRYVAYTRSLDTLVFVSSDTLTD